jgi:hypothetical protein
MNDAGLAVKRVFLGSSSASLDQAKDLKEAIEVDPNCKVDLWTDIFNEGAISIEAIESEARKCCAAVFIFSPDDNSVFRGKKILVARPNVQLEYGYFIALLGRERVLLCQYDNVTLPTDLAGLTVIRMGPFRNSNGVAAVMVAATQRRITQWTGRLEASAHGCAQIQIHHGYSGRWRIISDFTRWRGVDLGGNDFAQLKGYLDLSLKWDGTLGSGFLFGDFHVRFKECRAHFKACDVVRDVKINKDATILLTTEMFTRTKVKMEGRMPQSDGFRTRGGDTSVTWHLKPDRNHGSRFTGEYVVLEGSTKRSQSLVTAEKI